MRLVILTFSSPRHVRTSMSATVVLLVRCANGCSYRQIKASIAPGVRTFTGWLPVRAAVGGRLFGSADRRSSTDERQKNSSPQPDMLVAPGDYLVIGYEIPAA
jgi:hypothetical protein